MDIFYICFLAGLHKNSRFNIYLIFAKGGSLGQQQLMKFKLERDLHLDQGEEGRACVTFTF